MTDEPETVPHGVEFIHNDGRTAITTGALEAIANGILAAGVLVSPKPGQRIIDAVWNAQQTIDVLGWAGLVPAKPADTIALDRIAAELDQLERPLSLQGDWVWRMVDAVRSTGRQVHDLP